MKHYIHDIPGRLRVRCAAIKRNDTNAAAAKAFVASIAGVRSVETNTLTGSLTVLYDPELVRSSELLAALRAEGMLAAVPPRRSAHRLRNKLASRIAQYAFEAAVEKSVVALVGALL